jgi:hypothetical protein
LFSVCRHGRSAMVRIPQAWHRKQEQTEPGRGRRRPNFSSHRRSRLPTPSQTWSSRSSTSAVCLSVAGSANKALRPMGGWRVSAGVIRSEVQVAQHLPVITYRDQDRACRGGGGQPVPAVSSRLLETPGQGSCRPGSPPAPTGERPWKTNGVCYPDPWNQLTSVKVGTRASAEPPAVNGPSPQSDGTTR